MRPVLHGDVVAAARAIYAMPGQDRREAVRRLLREASWADRHRADTGQAHPFWGDGSLMAAALAAPVPKEPPLSDNDYCSCLTTVLEEVVDWRRADPSAPKRRTRRSGRSDQAPAA